MHCDLGALAIFYESYGSGRPIVMATPRTGHTPSVDRLATHDQMLDTMLAFIATVIPGQRFEPAGLSSQHRRKAR